MKPRTAQTHKLPSTTFFEQTSTLRKLKRNQDNLNRQLLRCVVVVVACCCWGSGADAPLTNYAYTFTYWQVNFIRLIRPTPRSGRQFFERSSQVKTRENLAKFHKWRWRPFHKLTQESKSTSKKNKSWTLTQHKREFQACFNVTRGRFFFS